MTPKNFDDYVDIGNVKIGGTVKILNSYYKIISVSGTNQKLELLCEQTEKTDDYTDLNHDFIKINNSVYEFESFIPLNKKIRINYKLLLKIPKQYSQMPAKSI